MSFYGNEFSRTISDTCFRITFISGSESHKSYNNFPFMFSISINNFLWLWGIAFLKFSENYNNETAWLGLYFVSPQFSGAETFLGGFSGIPRTNNQ